MAVGLNAPDQLCEIDGIELATVAAALRYVDRDDLLLLTCAVGTTAAAVFTQNKYAAAPVFVAKQHLEHGAPRALLINAGNANAGTGKLGIDNARANCVQVADLLDVEPFEVLPFSTGVIGEQLSMDKMRAGIEQLVQGLAPNNWRAAADAIMTTDTVAKGVSKKVKLGDQIVTITGITKGSGMIYPDMATMLAYVATDAAIEQPILQEMLARATRASFNRITVDGDTSTNDAVVALATGRSNAKVVDAAASEKFYQAFEGVLVSLATSVVRDGEGATKFVKIEVSSGLAEQDCEKIAYSVAHSPLVKTALFASDPNWGRILAAIGKVDVASLDIDKVNIQINGESLIESGEPAASYTEEIGKRVFTQQEITISIDLGLGDKAYHVWTSDLSHDYVSINADYRS